MADMKPEVKEMVERLLSSAVDDEDNYAELVADGWSRFVRRGLKYHYLNAQLLRALACGIRRRVDAEPKPRAVFDMVLGHSQFRHVLSANSGPRKESLVDLLLALVQTEPNCCRTDHVIVYLAAYNGTMALTDQKLLSLLHLYEKCGVCLDRYKPYVWSERALDFYTIGERLSTAQWRAPSVSAVMTLLDDARLHRSATAIPLARPWLDDEPNCLSSVSHEDATIYDPAFLLPLFRVVLDEYCASGQLDCETFLAKHCLSLCVAALALRSRDLRLLARHLIGRYVDLATAARFPQRELLLCLLKHLRNSLTRPRTRLSSVHANFYVRCIALLFKPEHRMFGVVWKFLMAKPSLNLYTVPEFQRLLYSSHIEHRVDRQWLLSLLGDSVKESRDFLLLERSRVFKHVLVLSLCPSVDPSAVLLVFRLVARTVRLPGAAFALLLHHHLAAWLHAAALRASSDPRRLESLREIAATVRAHVDRAPDSPNVQAVRAELAAVQMDVGV